MTATLPDEASAWVADWQRHLTDRPAFAEAADGFTATFRFEIQADDAYDGAPVAMTLVIEDGACVAASADGEVDYDFAIRGPYRAWKGLIGGDLDVAEAVMGGPLDLEGSKMTLLSRREAVAELVRAARETDLAFRY